LLYLIIAMQVAFQACYQWSSIESQHKEAHLKMFFKVIHGIVNLQLPTYIQHSSRPLRGNHLRYIQLAVNVDSAFTLQALE